MNITNTIIDRAEAQSRGLTRFFTGVPCKRDHICERFVSNGACVQCVNWVVPKKTRAAHHYLPPKPLFFGNAKRNPTMAEAQAAFRWMEAAGWHVQAINLMQDDPELMARFDHEWTNADREKYGTQYPDPTPTKKSG